MIFVALILAASSPADAVPKARQAYASCMGDYTRDAMDRKVARDTFIEGLETKCAKQEAKFREALIALDKADGMTDEEATEDADDQILGYVEKVTDDFDNAE